VLGTVEVRNAEGVEPIRSEKQRLIAGRLALAGGAPVSEHALFEELWDEPPSDPMHALHAHVSRLRQATGMAIEHTAGGYRIDTDQVDVDASRFEDLLRAARREQSDPEAVIAALHEAMALWRGPVLDGTPASSSLQADRARLELLFDEATTELVEAYLSSGQPERSLPLLRHAVDRNPVDERRWAQLMIALDRAGQRGQALEAYAEARDQLVSHLGLEPNARLQQIQQQILHADQPTQTVEPDVPLTSGDVVGRDHEWSVLTQLWRDTQQRQHVAVITGEPGIGKTFLASRFISALDDVTVRSRRCQDAHGAPYEALAALIRSDCAGLDAQRIAERLGVGASVLRSVVPDVLEQIGVDGSTYVAGLEPQVERHRIKIAVTEWLRRATRSGPICLFVDDLQWADPDSLVLIGELWSQPLDVPVLWIATLRDREHLPDSSAAKLIDRTVHPSDSVVHIELSSLDHAAVRELIGTTINKAGRDREVSASTVESTLKATGGNPLFVLESARHIDEHDGSSGLPAHAMPPTLAKVVDEHLARLNPTERELLDVAALVGEEFDPLLVGMATSQDPRALDSFLVVAQHFRLLEPLRADGLTHRFRHALVQAVILQQVPAVRRAELHLRIAQAVEQHPHVANRPYVLAHHYAQAVSLVGSDVAIAHLLAAATASMRQQAPAVALDLYRQAQSLLTIESPVAQRCEVHLGLGEAGFQTGADYRADLLTAARLANESRDVERLVRAAVANNRGWYSSIDDVDHDRVSVIEAALAHLPDGVDERWRPDRSRLLSLWAMENVRDPGRRADVLRSSEESMQLAQDLGDADLLGEIMCHRFSVLYATLNDPRATFEFARRLDDFARTRLDSELQLKSAIAVAQSAMMLGEYAVADKALGRSEQLALELAHPPRSWLVGTWIAARMAMRGDVEAAQERAGEAYEMGAAFGEADAFTFYAGQLFVFHHMSGRLPELIEAIEEQVATLTDQIPAWRAAYALALTTSDREIEARAIIDDFRSTDFADLPVDVLYLQGLSYLAEAVTTMGHRDAAERLYEMLLPYESMIASNATIDAGPIDLRLGTLAGLMGDTDAARRHLRSAEAFCAANDAVSWSAHVSRALADLPGHHT